MNKGINIRLVSVYGDTGRLSRLSPCNAGFSVDRKVQFLPPLREQTVACKFRLHGRVHHGRLAVIINLHALFIEIHEYKVITLLIKA